MLGAHSDTLVLVHVVFATANRRPWLTREFDGWYGDVALDACRRIGCELLAVGNGSDHVHVVLRLPPSIALSEAVRRLKGGSSHAWNAQSRGLCELSNAHLKHQHGVAQILVRGLAKVTCVALLAALAANLLQHATALLA